jgi:ribosomal protein S7
VFGIGLFVGVMIFWLKKLNRGQLADLSFQLLVKKNLNPSARSLANVLFRHGRGTLGRSVLRALWLQSKEIRSAVPPRLLLAVRPQVMLRSRRKAGISYRIPYLLSSAGQFSYALRWFRASLDERPERTHVRRAVGELLDLAQGRGGAFRRKDALHQTALLNRGFLRLLRRR